MIDLLKKLLLVNGIAGHEGPVREVIREAVGETCDLQTDALGNLFCSIGEGAPHTLLIAHMDEIGMVVTHIEENGTLRFRKVGGLDDRIFPSRRVIIHTESGPIEGVIGLTPPHLIVDRNSLKEIIPWHRQYIEL